MHPYYDAALNHLLYAAKNAHHKALHPKAMTSLRRSIEYAEQYAEHLAVTEGKDSAEKFRKEMKPHVDRAMSLIERNGTKFKKSQQGVVQTQLGMIAKLEQDLLKSADAFNAGDNSLLAKAAELKKAIAVLWMAKLKDMKAKKAKAKKAIAPATPAVPKPAAPAVPAAPKAPKPPALS